MDPNPSKHPEEIRSRQQLTAEIRAALRELGVQLALLNHQMSARLALKDVDLRALRKRNADLMRLYSRMNVSMNKLFAGCEDSELELLADFLRRTTNAGKTAADQLAADD